MIREEINELFVQMRIIESKPNNTDEFIQIVTDAFEVLNKLKNEYYLIPKENIDSNIKFTITDNELNNTSNVLAKFTICSISSIKRTLIELIHDDSVKIYLKNELIRTLERKRK